MAESQFSCDSYRTFRTPAAITGRIKSEPSDFEVDELLGFDPAGEGEHVYLHVEKTGANSGWVAWQLSELLGVRELDIGFAGRKDRHAVTRQWFSAWVPGRDIAGELAGLDIEGVRVLGSTRHTAKLRRGQLIGNRFRIRVRHDPLGPADRDNLEASLAGIAAEGFPNFFGPQRFGRGGSNLVKADRLLRGEKKTGGNRGMLISAARAWLFNHYLDNRLGDGGIPAGDGPLIGKSRDPQPGESEFDDLKQRWAQELRRLGARAESRPLWVHPGEMTWDTAETSSPLRFTLPAGSFATVLLREAFDVEDVSGDN